MAFTQGPRKRWVNQCWNSKARVPFRWQCRTALRRFECATSKAFDQKTGILDGVRSAIPESLTLER